MVTRTKEDEMDSMTLEQIEQAADRIEVVWGEFVDEAVIDQAVIAVGALRTLGTEIRRMRGMSLSPAGHNRFKPEDGEWVCHESCPRPDDECADLARQSRYDA